LALFPQVNGVFKGPFFRFHRFGKGLKAIIPIGRLGFQWVFGELPFFLGL